ncbi:MAG: hypothetical protein ACI3XA_08565 [Clostridia bacterium]
MKKVIILLLCSVFLLSGCSDYVTLTYPSYLFETEDALNETVDSLKGSEGMKKVTVNSDGSVTLKMTEERYEKIRNAAYSTVSGIPVYAISDTTAVKDYTANEDFTKIDITVDKESETLQSETQFIIYAVRLYHVCNMEENATVMVNLIDYETGNVYLTETYSVKDGDITTAPTEEPA